MEPLASLVAANLALVGGHFALSHPLRAPLVRALGEKGFLLLYTLVSLGALVWVVLAFRAVGPGHMPLWNGGNDVAWTIASLLTIVALVLFLGALKGNPAAPNTSAASVSGAQASGVYAVTRHPMMWGFAIWGVAHIVVMPSPRTLVTAGAVIVLALLGAHLQDRKKEALLGTAWQDWERRTSYWPRLGRLGSAGAMLWIAGVLVWLGLTWAHVWLAWVPAGIWRWVG